MSHSSCDDVCGRLAAELVSVALNDTSQTYDTKVDDTRGKKIQ